MRFLFGILTITLGAFIAYADVEKKASFSAGYSHAQIISGEDLIDTVSDADSLKTFSAVLKAADLEGMLKGAGPFTLFAPSDDALAKLPKGTLELLLMPENKDKLALILYQHIVPGRAVMSSRWSDAPATLNTLFNSQTIKIFNHGGTVMINDHAVVVLKNDIQTRNGVIHVIDTVLMPY